MDFEKMREAAIAELEGFRVLEESTDAAERQRAAFIAAALNTLPQQEQEILRQFFIDRRCRYAGHRAKLQAMYGLSLSELYRQKNEAITNYCMAALASGGRFKDENEVARIENAAMLKLRRDETLKALHYAHFPDDPQDVFGHSPTPLNVVIAAENWEEWIERAAEELRGLENGL